MEGTLADKLRAFDPDLPLERARTIPRAWYFDPDVYAAECRAVFGRTWQVAGRAEQVAGPGAFVTAEIAGEPVLVVRDREGVLRGFFNVCRHRAARVVNAPAGLATRLRCRYHGWTYDLAGCLRGTPEFDGVADFSRQEQGLAGLDADVWGPFVAIRQRAARAPESFADWLAPLPQRKAELDLEKLRFVERREYELACNWKVYVDNYLDGGYHVNTVHPGLAGVLDYAQYRTEVFDHASVQSSPLRPDGGAAGAVRTGNAAYYWWIFPNLMVNIYQGVMDTNLVLPLGPGRCRVIFDFYFAQSPGDGAERFIADSIAVADQIQQEDAGICEEVQKGLASSSYDTGRFSVRRETAGYHFHRLLARSLWEAARPAP
jgi:choline monooxygenase